MLKIIIHIMYHIHGISHIHVFFLEKTKDNEIPNLINFKILYMY